MKSFYSFTTVATGVTNFENDGWKDSSSLIVGIYGDGKSKIFSRNS